MARRSSKAHMAWVRSFRKNARKSGSKKKSTARRNPWPVSGLVVNPHRKRRKSTARRNSPVMRRRRSYKRNPAIMGFELPPVKSVLFAGVGFVGTPVLEGFLNQYVPASIATNSFGKYAVKIGSVIALAFAVKKVVGQEEGKMVAIGGGAYVLTSAVSEFAPGVIPGLSSYVAPNSTLAAYVQGNQRGFTQLGLPTGGGAAFGAGNTATGGTAERFRKF